MKLGPVTKLDKGNMAMSKKSDHGTSSANYDAIFIFPVSIQFGAIQKLDSRCMFCVVWWRDWGYTSNLGPPSNSGLADPHWPPNLFQSLNTTILLIPWNSPNDEMGEEYIWVWSTIQTNRKQNANNRKDFKQ